MPASSLSTVVANREETTYLQVPCLTFRDTTERPITVEFGTYRVMSDLYPDTVMGAVGEILAGKTKAGVIPNLWDGQAADRITEVLLSALD